MTCGMAEWCVWRAPRTPRARGSFRRAIRHIASRRCRDGLWHGEAAVRGEKALYEAAGMR